MSAYPPYPPAPVLPPRPPLRPEHGRAALLAGGWGFGLSTLGGGVIGLAFAALLVGLVLTWIVGLAAVSEAGASAELTDALGGFEVLASPPVVALFVATLFLGAALVALGIVLSARILRRRGVDRPWAITWAGWGVAVAASGVLGSIASLAGNVASLPLGVFRGQLDVPVELMIAAGVVAALVALAVNVVIGALAWWWMAYVLRPR